MLDSISGGLENATASIADGRAQVDAVIKGAGSARSVASPLPESLRQNLNMGGYMEGCVDACMRDRGAFRRPAGVTDFAMSQDEAGVAYPPANIAAGGEAIFHAPHGIFYGNRG